MKIIIAGGRDFKDRILMSNKMASLISNITDGIEIVSGGQVTVDKFTGEKYGADYLGEQWAEFNQYRVEKFPADWDTHGKSAGPKRNRQMAEYADALVAFWDGKSRGTKNMIDEAKSLGLKVRVIMY